MPSVDVKLKFLIWYKTQKCMSVVYADLEAINKQVKNSTASSTQLIER